MCPPISPPKIPQNSPTEIHTHNFKFPVPSRFQSARLTFHSQQIIQISNSLLLIIRRMHNRHVRYLGRLADGFGDPLAEMIDSIKERKLSHREVYRPTSLHVKIDRRIERSRRRSRSPLAANHK